jgi:hypothetical protein
MPGIQSFRPMTPRKALFYGGLVAAVADLVEVTGFYSARGVPAIRVLQGVASGLLGRAAFSGGAASALLGLLLDLTIVYAIVAVYHLAARHWPELARRPLTYGPLYGLVTYTVMYHVVLPLSAAGGGAKSLAASVNGVVCHVLILGLLSAWFARAGQVAAPAPARMAALS